MPKIMMRLLPVALGLVVAIAVLELGTAWWDPPGSSWFRDMRT